MACPDRQPSSRAASRSTSAWSTPCAATWRRCACDVDTVILGCTHYPLIAPMLQRMLGRGVRIVTSGAPVAHQVEHVLGARGLASPHVGEGDYRFLTTGDVEAFRALGSVFLQLPLGDVERVALRAAEAAARAGVRARARRAAPGHHRARFRGPVTGSVLMSAGETRVICTASHTDGVPKWLAGSGRGWVTAEYGMLPASTGDRRQRRHAGARTGAVISA